MRRREFLWLLAMGAYTAFPDVALGRGKPALGFVAEHAGLGSVFGASIVAALGGVWERANHASWASTDWLGRCCTRL
jgi:hypothetical protein